MELDNKKQKSWIVNMHTREGVTLAVYVHALDIEHAVTVARVQIEGFINSYAFVSIGEIAFDEGLDSKLVIEI